MSRIAQAAHKAAIVMMVVFASSITQAGTVVGDNFTISYTSEAALGLYGVPQIFGNNIFFSPNPDFFQADSLDGASDAVSSTATFDITAHTGFDLDSLILVERGNYLLNGAGSEVTHNGKLIVNDPNDIFASPINEDIAELAPLTVNDNAQHSWEARATADIAASLFSGATLVHVQIQNNLSGTTSGPGSRAFIEKNFSAAPVMLGINEFPAEAVPLPGAVWLMGSGLLGLLGFSRRAA